jgi:hypothetical protein
MGTCKWVHNFWGESRLLEIPCLPVFRELCVESRSSCVRGLPLIFQTPNIGTHRGFSRRTAHDATTKEIQEECSHWDRPRRAPSWWRQLNLSHSRTFAHHRSRTKGKTRGSLESKSWEDSTHSRTTRRTRCSWRWWWWGCRQRTRDSTQQIPQLQKEKERFTNQLQEKRKASEKLEKLNQAKEQIEIIQREIEEMKEQENSSLWQDSPHQNSGQNRRTP